MRAVLYAVPLLGIKENGHEFRNGFDVDIKVILAELEITPIGGIIRSTEEHKPIGRPDKHSRKV